MNLFVTSEDPVDCARALDDKRVGKLLMEANQMLSLAVKIHHKEDPRFLSVGPGQLTEGFAHKNHPVSIWVRETYGNFFWTVQHALALGNEFAFRFGKQHASADRTEFIFNRYRDVIPRGDRTPFQNSARNAGRGVDCTDLPVLLAYRVYLRCRWGTDIRPAEWTRRGPPEWRDNPKIMQMAMARSHDAATR